MQSEEWEFIQVTPDSWKTLNTDLQSSLENLRYPHSCQNLCLFAPELVSSVLSVNKFKEFCDVIHTYRAMHSIETIHLLTPLISTGFLTDLQRLAPKNLGSIKVHTLCANSALERYPCFISDLHHHHHGHSAATDEDDIDLASKSSQMKIEAFHLTGTLDYAALLEAFNRRIL